MENPNFRNHEQEKRSDYYYAVGTVIVPGKVPYVKSHFEKVPEINTMTEDEFLAFMNEQITQDRLYKAARFGTHAAAFRFSDEVSELSIMEIDDSRNSQQKAGYVHVDNPYDIQILLPNVFHPVYVSGSYANHPFALTFHYAKYQVDEKHEPLYRRSNLDR